MWFGFDPLGHCVKRWVGDSGDVSSNPATYFHYEGWNLLQEGNNAWGPSRVYVHGNRIDEIVWSNNAFTGEQAFHQYDARGHCTLLTDNFGTILEQYEYDAFGWPYIYDSLGNSASESPFGNRFLFSGREWLSDLRLIDFRARMYQPELGRFLQPDPKHFAAGDYNLYRYCHNDPVNRSDPFGLASFSGTLQYQRFGTVLGTQIPRWLTVQSFAVNFTTSGNYGNSDLDAHISDNSVIIRGSEAKGWTDSNVAVDKASDTALRANLNIDWWIKRGVSPFIAELEKQHTFGDANGGSKSKGLLEAGGYWSRMQARYSSGISGRFWFHGIDSARADLEGILEFQLSQARTQQINEWDCRECNHDR